MWLVGLSLAAAVVTAIWYYKDGKDELKLGFLSLLLWGTTVMVFVDHVMGYLTERGEFFDMTLESALLNVVLVTIALMVWEVVLLLKDPKGRLKILFKLS